MNKISQGNQLPHNHFFALKSPGKDRPLRKQATDWETHLIQNFKKMGTGKDNSARLCYLLLLFNANCYIYYN